MTYFPSHWWIDEVYFPEVWWGELGQAAPSDRTVHAIRREGEVVAGAGGAAVVAVKRDNDVVLNPGTGVVTSTAPGTSVTIK